jgi:CvfB-like winged helix domain
MAALEATEDGELAVGDKSSPEDIWKILPGLSKAQYKAGIGALLRWGGMISPSIFDTAASFLFSSTSFIWTPASENYSILLVSPTPSHQLPRSCREGAITTSADRLTLVPPSERTPMEALPYSGKSPKGWRAPEGTTLFVGNLAFSVDNMRCFISILILFWNWTVYGFDVLDLF